VWSFQSGRLSALAASLKASGRAGRRDDPVAGILWVTLSMALLSGLAALGKYAAARGVPPLEVVFFRNLFCVLTLSPLLYWRGVSLVQSPQLPLYGLRAGLSLLSMLAWFTALSMIPLAELTAISFLAPLFGTLAAILMLGEAVRWRRLTALLAGFLGAMIILRPGASPVGLGQLLAVVSALTMGFVAPLVKQLTLKDDADKIVFLTNLIITPLSLIPALFVWVWPPLDVWLVFIGIGMLAVAGHLALVRGFASTDASLVMTFEFSRLPFAVLIGWIVFGETTDVWTWIGALVIFGSALYITRRESMLKAQGHLVRARIVSDPLSLTPLRMAE